MKMYVINLDTRPDRFKRVSAQFLERNISLIRISAISGDELINSGHDTVAPPNNQAVWLSHQKVYRELIASEDKYCVVFEDDVVMTEAAFRLLERFEIICSELSNVDYFQFGYLTYRGRLDSGEFDFIFRTFQRIRTVLYCWLGSVTEILQSYLIGIRILRRLNDVTRKTWNRVGKFIHMRDLAKILKLKSPLVYSNESGGHAYIISRTFATDLLKYNLPLFLVTDLAIMSLSKAGNFHIYRTSKSLAFQDDSHVSTGLHSTQRFDIGELL